MQSTGCHDCKQSGYAGRLALFEVLCIDDEIKDMIVKRVSDKEIKKLAQKAGKLKTLKEDGAERILQGITTMDEASSVVG